METSGLPDAGELAAIAKLDQQDQTNQQPGEDHGRPSSLSTGTT
jgi:hypothetical protein